MVFLKLACALLRSSGESKFGGGSHTRRPAVSPTVSVGAEGRELTYRWTKGLCPQSSFSQSQLYPRSNDNLTPKQQIPFLSSEGT